MLNEENYNLAISCFWETPIEEHRAKFVPKTAECSEIGQSCRRPWYASCARSKICTFRAVSAKVYRPFSCSNWEEVDYVSPDQSLV